MYARTRHECRSSYVHRETRHADVPDQQLHCCARPGGRRSSRSCSRQAAPPVGRLARRWAWSGRRIRERSRAAWSGAGRMFPPPSFWKRRARRRRTPTSAPRINRSFRTTWKSIPRPRGSLMGLPTSLGPRRAIPQMVQELIAKKPKVEMDQKNCDFLPHSAGHPSGPDPGDEVERSRRS